LYLHININWFVTTNDIDTIKDNPSKVWNRNLRVFLCDCCTSVKWNTLLDAISIWLYYYLHRNLYSFCLAYTMYNIIVVKRPRRFKKYSWVSKTSNFFLDKCFFNSCLRYINRKYISRIYILYHSNFELLNCIVSYINSVVNRDIYVRIDESNIKTRRVIKT